MVKGEIAHHEQFLLLPQRFQYSSAAEASEDVYMREMVINRQEPCPTKKSRVCEHCLLTVPAALSISVPIFLKQTLPCSKTADTIVYVLRILEYFDNSKVNSADFR